MVKDIVKDEEILSQVCEKATADDADVAQDLLDTIASLEEPACLAANQIGVTKAVVVYLDENDDPHVMYNPILKQGLYPSRVTETCFSHDSEAKVNRFGQIKVAYEELVDGELVPKSQKFVGWTAITVQHMIDHCKGKLI